MLLGLILRASVAGGCNLALARFYNDRGSGLFTRPKRSPTSIKESAALLLNSSEKPPFAPCANSACALSEFRDAESPRLICQLLLSRMAALFPVALEIGFAGIELGCKRSLIEISGSSKRPNSHS